ncbi:MAG: alpha/beta fold hydrolase [Anaerolineaceae bacterium]|nr:MAG: alpha/beta fold hydrolase [Anaerolineaceae bacterium]
MKKKLRGLKRQAIQLDFNLYRVEVPMVDTPRHRLSVIDMWPEGKDRTIVFVHGYAGCAETWEYQINHFARYYRIIAPDLRGHGQSDAPFTRYTMDELVSDLQSIVTERDLPEKFILVGHSFGGAICVEYANRYPNRLEKLVLIATAGEYPLPRRAIWAYRIPSWFYRLWWDYRPSYNAEVHVMKRMAYNNMRRWRGWPLLRNLTVPTLVITGEADNYFPRWVFEEAAGMIPSAERVEIGSAKHKVQLERHEAVNRAIHRSIDPDFEKASWRDDLSSDLGRKRPWITSYSKETPTTIPIPRQPVDKFLESAADWAPRKTATIFFGQKMSYQQLNTAVNRFANALIRLGLQAEERVMIVLPNSPQFLIAYYGIMRAGGTVVLPNPDASTAQICQQIKETDAHTFITLRSYANLATKVKALACVENVIFTSVRPIVPDNEYSEIIEQRDDIYEQSYALGRGMNEMMRTMPETAPEINVPYTRRALIIYTNGIMDRPKGVCLTHLNLVANTLQVRHWIPDLQFGKETFLTVLPLSHSYGMTAAMNLPVAIGATMVLLPGFELKQALNHIKKYRPTIFPGVPSIYTAINHAPRIRSYRLSSIKACISGAAPLPIEVQEEFERLTRGRLVEGYSLTECSPITHANPLYGVRKVGSIGVPIPNTDAKIIDPATGETQPPGVIGELAIRGPQVMQGYWRDNDETADTVLIDDWLHTGDIAVMDPDGYFKLISRKRDTIISDGHNVYPRDVEEVLYENSKVLEAAVVSTHAADGTHKIKAFVVPKPNSSLSEMELFDLCRRRLEPYAVPDQITLRDELPKSFIGKVLNRLLIEEA